MRAKLEIDDSLTPSATASETLLPPAIDPDLPVSVSVDSSAGDVTLNLITGGTSGTPAGLSASPSSFPFIKLKPPSASELLAAIHPQHGWFVIPLGKASRSLTLTLSNILPLSFAATLEDDLGAKYQLNQIELEVLAASAAVAVVVAAIVATAPEDVAALAAAGISDAADAVSTAIESIVVPALERAAVPVIASIPGDLTTDAGAVWGSLTGFASFAAEPARTASFPVEGPPTSLARVVPLRASDLYGLRAQRLRGALEKAAQASLLTLPVATTVRPLVVSNRLPAGGRAVTLLGGDLPGKKAQLVIAGPGYAAVDDVRVTDGLAGGQIVLPRGRRPGRWYAGIVDFGALHVSHGHLAGHAILEAASWVATR